jgi:hypothetical protein
MKNGSFLKATGLIGCCVLTGLFAIYAQDSVEGWNLYTNNTGSISMEYQNPDTYLKIQKYIRIDLDKNWEASGGAVKFLNGFERDMLKQEAASYWEQFKGRHALWSYLSEKGKLNDLASQNASIPDGYYGKMTRVVINNNKEFFGMLQKSPGAPEVILLANEGASGGPLSIERKMIKLMQQIK